MTLTERFLTFTFDYELCAQTFDKEWDDLEIALCFLFSK